jgi:hypothetical protein
LRGELGLLAKLRDGDWDRRLGLASGNLSDSQLAPHLLYANLDFGKAQLDKQGRRLVSWCQGIGRHWTENRIVSYLRLHQSEFRACLRWLIDDAVVDFEEDFDPGEALDLVDLEDDWRLDKHVKFLQLHGVSHNILSLHPQIRPSDSGTPFFARLNLGQTRAKDPLDLICWHILYLLMRDGILDIRECWFGGCEKFFRPLTKRRLYCSALCRAKDHAKSKEQNRIYMRKYRQIPRNRRLQAAKRASVRT